MENSLRHRWERSARALEMLRLGLVATLFLSVGCASSAKGPTGSLVGIAADNSGNPLPGITVSLRSEAGKIVQEVLTSADGSYRFEDAPVGQYQVTTNFAGFTAPKPLAVTVTPGTTTTLPRLVLLPPQ